MTHLIEVSLGTKDGNLSIKISLSCCHFLMWHIATAVDYHTRSSTDFQSFGLVWFRPFSWNMDPQTIAPPLPLEVIYWASSSEDSTQKVKFCDVHPEFPWIISAEKNVISVWDFVRWVVSLPLINSPVDFELISNKGEIVCWKSHCMMSWSLGRGRRRLRSNSSMQLRHRNFNSINLLLQDELLTQVRIPTAL